MVNDETIRAKNKVGKTHHQTMGRKQDRHGPVVKLVSVPEPKGFEVRDVARQG